MLEPSNFQVHKRRIKIRWLTPLIVLALIAGGAYGLWQWFYGRTVPPRTTEQPAPAPPPDPTPIAETKSGNVKQFTGEQFKELYRSVQYPNIQSFSEPPPISGNAVVDTRIRTRSEARGYRLSNIPVTSIVKINEPRLGNDDLLQPLAAQAWQALKAAALKDGKRLSLISAFRSPEYQRDLFMERLLAHGVSVSEFADAAAARRLKQRWILRAVPGYSRHHTGYTIDVWCEDGAAVLPAAVVLNGLMPIITNMPKNMAGFPATRRVQRSKDRNRKLGNMSGSARTYSMSNFNLQFSINYQFTINN